MQYGLIAEDVQQVLPQLVKEISTPVKYDSMGTVQQASLHFKALNYTGLIPILIAAAKEQQWHIDSLDQALNALATQLETCCGTTQSSSSGARLSVTLENTTAIILDQNTPNPFAEQTTITFSIPEDIGSAMIAFYDKSGRVMKMLTIDERGKGSITVFAEKLSSGIYSYSLIADGKVIDTKKMVCSK